MTGSKTHNQELLWQPLFLKFN